MFSGNSAPIKLRLGIDEQISGSDHAFALVQTFKNLPAFIAQNAQFDFSRLVSSSVLFNVSDRLAAGIQNCGSWYDERIWKINLHHAFGINPVQKFALFFSVAFN